MKIYFPIEVVEHIFSYVTSHKDRNALSMVCISWCRIERYSRRGVFVGNCYAISPERTIATFPAMKSLTLKGKPHFADFKFVKRDWGGSAGPWIEALVAGRVGLEGIRLKRMIVSDENLELISRSFPNFKSLVLVSCEGFTTNGLAAIASNCRYLEELELQKSEIDDANGQWLSFFSETCTSLVSLNFACLRGPINITELERLVARSPNLKTLRLNNSVPLNTLLKILAKAPQLVDLGTGSVFQNPYGANYHRLRKALSNCNWIRSLSGYLGVWPQYWNVFDPISSKLTSLNLSYAVHLHGTSLVNLVSHCTKLQRLWIADCIGDKGLAAISSSCKELRELHVFFSDTYGSGHVYVTEEGLILISANIPNLHTLSYSCAQMTNVALGALAKNCPNLVRFRLFIVDPTKPDHVTLQPLDAGFEVIVQFCKRLKKLSLSGLLTDQVFLYTGIYAENLETLSVASAGGCVNGISYVLKGCGKLKKLEIKDCQSNDVAVLETAGNHETLQSLSMSSSMVWLGGSKTVTEKIPNLNVEISKNSVFDIKCVRTRMVEKVYLYRTLVGPRNDAPEYVRILY